MAYLSANVVKGRFRPSLGLLLAVILLLTIGAHSAPILGDQAALRAIATAYPMLQSGNNAWSTTDAMQACVGPWRGVICEPTSGPNQIVVQLNLTNEQLTGQMASSIFQLNALQSLDLSQNSLTGPIGTQWASMSSLAYLNLNSNFLSGEIPMEIGLLSGTNMLHLDLSHNNLTGDVPGNLTNLVSLTHLILSGNQLGGKFLASIGTFSKLEVLAAASTKLQPVSAWYLPNTYCVPPEISNCSHLRTIDLKNAVRLCFWPEEMGQLLELESLSVCSGLNFPNVTRSQQLKELDLDFSTSKNVTLPEDMGDMISLEKLTLTGLVNPTFPSSFANLLNLTHLSLGHCAIRGPLPAPFYLLSSVKHLSISFNQITGLLPLDSWPNIQYLDASSNKFDSLPATLSAPLTSLKNMILSDNAFVGPFPSWLGELTSLTMLGLGQNGFTTLPSTIGNLVNLQSVYSMNPFVDLPYEMKMLTQLSILTISSANFAMMPFNATHQHSKLFDIVSDLKALTLLLVDYSGLTGTVPDSIGQLSNLTELHLSNNAISGTIPLAMRSSLPDLRVLSLEKNQFNGTIPDWLSEKTQLYRLQLSRNRFTGTLPASLAELKIRVLDLSNNRLSGSIPYAYGEAPYIVGFDLSHNNLSGSIPTSFNRTSPSTYFSLLDLSYNRLTFCPSEIQQFPFYLQTNGICDLRNQIEKWTRPYDCGCNYDAFLHCKVDYPLEQCVPCAGNPPSQDNFECQHGIWVLVGENPSLTNTTLIIGPTPVVIPGNLTSSPVTFQGPDSTLTVGGCATLTSITVELTVEDLEKLAKLNKEGRTKELVKSGCDVGSVPLSVGNPPKSCASASAQTVINGGSISAIFVIDRSKCKIQWWIILLCVLLAVAVITLATALIWYLIRRRKNLNQHKKVSSREPAPHQKEPVH